MSDSDFHFASTTGPGFAANLYTLWAIPTRADRVPNLVIRVAPPQQGCKAVDTNEQHHSIMGWAECGDTWHDLDTNVDGCDLDCLAVVVGECLVTKLSPGSKTSHITIDYPHDCDSCFTRLHMTYPMNNVARFAMVKMLADQSNTLYILTRDELDVPYTTRRFLPYAGFIMLDAAFYNEFWTFPLPESWTSRMQQIRSKISAFCRDYQKARSGDGNRNVNKHSAATFSEATEEEQDDTAESSADATSRERDECPTPLAVTQSVATGCTSLTGTDEIRCARSGAGDAGGSDEADQVLVGSAAEQRAAARPRGVDAVTSTEERSALETFDMVLAIFLCLYYGVSGCLWAIVAQGRKLWCFPFRLVVVRDGRDQRQAAPVKKREWVFRKRDQRFLVKN